MTNPSSNLCALSWIASASVKIEQIPNGKGKPFLLPPSKQMPVIT
jgi:hypothetical protein